MSCVRGFLLFSCGRFEHGGEWLFASWFLVGSAEPTCFLAARRSPIYHIY